MFWNLVLDTLVDGLKVLPFLFGAYLLIELLEHHAGDKTARVVQRAGRFGPAVGAVVGVIPQCGFSTVAANLYAGGVITAGTILAVFLSTSDEMLPVFVSQGVPARLIFAVLGYKILAAVLVGFAADLIIRRPEGKSIHELCRQAGCRCEQGPVRSALRHTVKIFLFLLAVTFAINLLVGYLGPDALASSVLRVPLLGELLAALIGLIPNCAGSVVVAQLYLQGAMAAGPMLAGVLASAGVGLLVLFRMNRNVRQNLALVAVLYGSAVLFGFAAEFLPWF